MLKCIPFFQFLKRNLQGTDREKSSDRTFLSTSKCLYDTKERNKRMPWRQQRHFLWINSRFPSLKRTAGIYKKKNPKQPRSWLRIRGCLYRIIYIIIIIILFSRYRDFPALTQDTSTIHTVWKNLEKNVKESTKV